MSFSGWANPLAHNSLTVSQQEMGHGLGWQVKDKHVRDKIKQTQYRSAIKSLYRSQPEHTHANKTTLCLSALLFRHVPVIFTSHFGHTFHISLKKDMFYTDILSAQCWVMNCLSTPHIYMFISEVQEKCKWCG